MGCEIHLPNLLHLAHLQVAYDDFVAAGSLAAAREKGLVG
jgi:hypothetical protein